MGAKITTPTKKLGDWLSRTPNTEYQALADGFVVAYNSTSLIGYLDDTTPAITEIQQNAGVTASIGFPVKKNEYWKVSAADQYLFWIPLQ